MEKISYIIVTWNNAAIIEECITTLIQFSPYQNEIIIVDNDSKDGTCEAVKKLGQKDIKIVETHQNLGFSKANNIGIQHATGNYVFFVNPDVIFIEDVVTPMLKILRKNPNIGIVSPRLLYKNKTFQVSCCNFPSAKKVFWDDMHFYKLLPEDKVMEYAQAQYRGSKDHIVDWTYGAAHLCRMKDLKDVGGYPEGYFMYGEDTEFCMIFLDKLGKKTYYLWDSKLVHLGGYSEKQVLSSKKVNYGTTAAIFFVRKYYGENACIRYRIALSCVSLVKTFAFSLMCVFSPKQHYINQKIKWKETFRIATSYKGKE